MKKISLEHLPECWFAMSDWGHRSHIVRPESPDVALCAVRLKERHQGWTKVDQWYGLCQRCDRIRTARLVRQALKEDRRERRQRILRGKAKRESRREQPDV